MTSHRTRAFLRCQCALAALLSVGSFACAEISATNGKTTSSSGDPLRRIAAAELYREGANLAAAGDALRAQEYLSAAIQRGYPAEQVMPLLMRVCIASSRLGVALIYAEPYLRLHPDDYHLRYLVAAVELGLGRASEARMDLQRVLAEAPDYAEAHYLLGLVLRDSFDDAEGAAHAFTDHLRLKPDGLHGAEVAAWLRERARNAPSQPTAAEASAPEAAPARLEEPPPKAADEEAR